MYRYLLLSLCVTLSFLPISVSTSYGGEKILLKDSINATVYESDTEALLSWRMNLPGRPTLVLLSNNPFLTPLPETIKTDIKDLVLRGSSEQIRRKAVMTGSDPLLYPGMGLSAALDAKLFSEVIWIIPLTKERPLPELEILSQQLRDHGVMSKTELSSLKKVDDHVSGKVRGIAFSIYASHSLPKLKKNLVMHLDLSYFSALYRNEIKTPIYPLIGQQLRSWKNQNWPVKQISISLGNLLGNVPLGSRFMGDNLRTLFNKPNILMDQLPQIWRLRAKALYLENFFKKEEMLEIFQKMDQLEPENAATQYGLYQVQRRFKNGDKALQHLAEAVRIDPGYALEYYTLAETALKKKRPAAALQMLSLASAQQPANPGPLLRQLDILVQINHPQPMAGLLEQLNKMTWSEIYYPGMGKHLQHYQDILEKSAAKNVVE